MKPDHYKYEQETKELFACHIKYTRSVTILKCNTEMPPFSATENSVFWGSHAVKKLS